MLLNRSNRVLGISCISKGGISGTVVDVKIILQTALKANASGLIISHNHPSGNLTASSEDIKITVKLKNACKLLDLSLLDHLIITDEGYLSFADEGML
jgi:DNA repair protein RadC